MTFLELLNRFEADADCLALHTGEPEKLEGEILDIVYDSRLASAGKAFVALPGRTVDGAKFLPQAAEQGAALLISEHPLSDFPDVSANNFLQVKSARRALATLSSLFFGEPSKKLNVIGITGTKGKSSIAHLLYQSLLHLGQLPLLIGTTGIHFKDHVTDTPNTTPESYVLQKHMAEALAQGATHVVMELSSQALDMDRAWALDLDLAIFTNLSRDHIGPKEHPTYEAYRAAKAKIFQFAKTSLINLDAPEADYMIQHAKDPFFFTTDPTKAGPQTYLAADIERGANTLSFTFNGERVTLHPAARFLMENTLAALAALDLLGFPAKNTASFIHTIHIPGRLETVPNDIGATIVIDYAHNGLSLENLLGALKDLKPRRLIALFGSVGDKSKERRQELAEVAEHWVDKAYVTSDNPEFEDPAKIVADIASHFSPAFTNYVLEPDRETAIQKAVAELEPGDCLALCGKGHEDFQLVKGKKIPLNERQIVEEALKHKA